MISIIAAIGKNNELGKDNNLLWKIKGDLPRFKKITWGHPVIMGRKTHSTFQYNGGPLPGRTNIVITHNKTFHPEGFLICYSLEDALSVAKNSEGSEEVFIIGGGSIYAQALPFVDRLYLTTVDKVAEADTFFPDYSQFTEVLSTEPQQNDDFSYSYITLERKK